MPRDVPTTPDRAPRVPPYQRYAAVYDEIGQRDFGERIAEATLRYLQSSGRTPKSAVDLACGTGAATLVLAAAGIAVTGIDRSPEMLAVARRTLAASGLHAEFIEQDIRDVDLPNKVELATCFYDSLNYLLTADDLGRAFRQVRNLLTSDGLFIFDLNTREKFSTAWSNSCYVAVDREGLFGIYQSWFEPETGLSPLMLTFFVKDAVGAWERFDEEHVERAYDLDEVGAMLREAGFEVEAILDYRHRSPVFGGPGSERSHRVVFIATPSGETRSFDES